jgi:hypothetical protein
VELGDGVLDLHDDRRLDPLGRLIEHQQPGPGHEGPGERQLLRLSARQQPGRPAHHRSQCREQVNGVADGVGVGATSPLVDDVQVLTHRLI